jgi:hypothetical protein
MPNAARWAFRDIRERRESFGLVADVRREAPPVDLFFRLGLSERPSRGRQSGKRQRGDGFLVRGPSRVALSLRSEFGHRRVADLLPRCEWRAEIGELCLYPRIVWPDAVRQSEIASKRDHDIHDVVREISAVKAGEVETRIRSEFIR